MKLMKRGARRWLAATLALAALAACAPPHVEAPAPKSAESRVLLVSFDALNERRALETVPRHNIPSFNALFAGGRCAEYAVPAWPSKTSASHASLWTGVYGDSSGIAANAQPPLPRDQHRITDRVSGYSNQGLRAEPVWLTEALRGRRVVGHHPTQAPGAPGYPGVLSTDAVPTTLMRRAEQALASPGLAVLNGYNSQLEPDRILTEDSIAPRPAHGWQGLESLGSGVEPLELAFTIGQDSVFALLHGDSSYTTITAARTRSAGAGAVSASAQPADRTSPAQQKLARHFSGPLPVGSDSAPATAFLRLFELTPDGSSLTLFMPAVAQVEANRPELVRDYLDATGGWVGNGGRILNDGTDEGTWRYLESLQLVTRQFMRGSEWGWKERDAQLQLDYFPLIDEVDHRWYGYVAPETPGVADSVRRRVDQWRDHAWALADMRLAHLMQLVARDSSVLVVSGDHGMRPTWRVFRPNVALREAGLLVADSSNRIIAGRTKALAPDGLYISLNTTDWLDGIVTDAERESVLQRAEAALRAVRGADGKPVVTQTWRVNSQDSLGRGGPVGGEIYYETAPGYFWTRALDGPAAGPGRIGADHGYPSISPDMYTVLCAWGPAVPAARVGPARTIDAVRWVLASLRAGSE